jgi:hypothetical protein
MVCALVKHFVKSIHHYRLTAFYLVAGVVLATVHSPITYINRPAAQPAQRQYANHDPSRMPIPSRFRLDIGEPPASVFHIARIAIAGWFAFLGAFWDVRRRMREWALIRLYGGHPSFVAGFQYFCLAFLGALIGGGFALLSGPARSLRDAFWLMTATLGWGFVFSCCVSIGPIVYTEFCDVVAVFRIEGEVR